MGDTPCISPSVMQLHCILTQLAMSFISVYQNLSIMQVKCRLDFRVWQT